MTILEQLREKRKLLDNGYETKEILEVCDLVNAYDLALENALLKLKNRSVEIKDLKHRLNEATNVANAGLDICCPNDCKICFGRKVCISSSIR